ncbi:MAG: Uncharacterised protein [Flavobacteriaceae bacterium]|nr:MAG: Uncharacterised protein [Flavobacteriaceae bacterium]
MGIVKKTFLALVVISLGLVLVIQWLSKPLPESIAGPEADGLARDVQEALNITGYKALNEIQFSFRDHHYLWNKAEERVLVSWEDYQVDLVLSETENSKILQGGKESNRIDLIDKAKAYFYNDSYWLVAPFKFFDPGVVRSLVETNNGSKALLITHTSGGVTPGDSYLWHFDENLIPTHFELWVSIIPIKGVSATWSSWVSKQDVLFSTFHKLGPLEITIGDLKVY